MASSSTNEDSAVHQLQDLTQRAWEIYKSLTSAPEGLRDLQEAVLSIAGPLRLVYEHAEEQTFSQPQYATLRDHTERVDHVIKNVEKDLAALRQQRASVQDVAKNATKLVSHSARLSAFYEQLQRESGTSTIVALLNIKENEPSALQSQEWSDLETQLQRRNVSPESIATNYFVINTWLQHSGIQRANLNSSLPPTTQSEASALSRTLTEIPQPNVHTSNPEATVASSSASRAQFLVSRPMDDEELPDYDPGTRSMNIAEKASNLERTEAILNAESAVNNPGAPSKSDPPAYTFEGDGDNEMDDELSQYINQAVAEELKRRYRIREVYPKEGTFVYSWLPHAMQQAFTGRPEIVSLLDAKSFTVMGYETAPRIIKEVESILPLLRMSRDGSGDDTVFVNASNTVKIIVKALTKFVNVQSPTPGDNFSDLDAFDYEYDVARTVDDRVVFPTDQFDFIQKSYYNLLTYLMGMTKLLCETFTGQTFVQRSREELSLIWSQKRLGARTAWIQKQLARWSTVDEAVLLCRDWHALRSALVRPTAFRALKAWQSSVNMLLSVSPPNVIKLKVISASGLPKTHNFKCQITLYAINSRTQGAYWSGAVFNAESPVVKNTQNPIFNYDASIELPEEPKMLDMVLWDVGMTGSKEVGRVRLKFSRVAGVENTFDGKDLLYGFDEELATPIPPSVLSKGKDTADLPLLHYQLSWDGRYKYLEDAGLPLNPPGKMFRPTRSHVPLPFPPGANFVDELPRR